MRGPNTTAGLFFFCCTDVAEYRQLPRRPDFKSHRQRISRKTIQILGKAVSLALTEIRNYSNYDWTVSKHVVKLVLVLELWIQLERAGLNFSGVWRLVVVEIMYACVQVLPELKMDSKLVGRTGSVSVINDLRCKLQVGCEQETLTGDGWSHCEAD